MRRLICILIALFTASLAAEAAERRLLSPLTAGETLARAPEAGARLGELRKAAAAGGKLMVIVGLRVPFAAEGELSSQDQALQRRDIRAAANTLQGRFAASLRRAPEAFRSYETIPFVAMEVTPAELEALAADPLVISITENSKLYPNLAESGPLVRAPQAWAEGFSGKGQTIAIIDSGVEATHPFLAGKVVAEACYSTSKLCPGGVATLTGPGSGAPCKLSGCWHGTHVAGIAAGTGSAFSGIARDANIISILTASWDAKAGAITHYQSDVIAGLEQVYRLRSQFSIAAVNLSQGYGLFDATCDDLWPAVTAAIGNLNAAGIATVASAGNNGDQISIDFPACIASVVSVGAVSDADWGPCGNGGPPTAADKITCFSNISPFLSLLAPGAMITSSLPGGGFRDAAGTSMAAPHVAGAIAVLRQKAPAASVQELLTALQDSGSPVRDERHGNTQGAVTPRIDVAAALRRFVDVNVMMTGNTTGLVHTTQGNATIACLQNCVRTVPVGASVKLSGFTSLGSQWAGWSGPCSGLGDCWLRPNGNVTVTATFNTLPVFTLAIVKAGNGAGTISFSPPGIADSCDASCNKAFNAGTAVKLAAKPAPGMKFAGWSGDCKGKAACSLKMTAAKSVTATFTAR